MGWKSKIFYNNIKPKCVGGSNLIMFYIFVASVPLFFCFIMVMASIIPLEIEKQQRALHQQQSHHHNI